MEYTLPGQIASYWCMLSTATRGGQDRNRQEGAKEVVEYRGKVADRCVSQD